MLKILEGDIPNSDNYNSSVRDIKNINYLVIHYTGNKGDTAQNNVDYFARESVKSSAHYFVDENSIITSVPELCTAYAVGADKYYNDVRNSNSISIEMCDSVEFIPEKTQQNTIDLIKYLIKRYNIKAVVRHYDVTRKLCPLPLIDESEWEAFLFQVTKVEDTNHWAYKFYENLKANGMTIHDTRFDEPITRGEVFNLLNQITEM